ncbi:hypothetical protein M378DRAFT_15783 [Amanita muscaria Koide BX008]|uniref:Uncharacterized protein n=1 Tax=Amanita muscaria (strain Koide BX008) TaxID=946122 RepID=A0A0C2WA54_AMAMK|nr:hypothetical protein M378DRAFT_15783 [Amanita muscaria Koide BX008]
MFKRRTSASVRNGRERAEEIEPEKQSGLVPNGKGDSSDIFVGEKMGKETQARAQRKATGQEVEILEKAPAQHGMNPVFQAMEVDNAMLQVPGCEEMTRFNLKNRRSCTTWCSTMVQPQPLPPPRPRP